MLVQFCYSQGMQWSWETTIYRFQIPTFDNLLQEWNLRTTGSFFDGKTPMTDGFPAQKDCNAEIVPCHGVIMKWANNFHRIKIYLDLFYALFCFGYTLIFSTHMTQLHKYRKVPNIRRALVGNKIGDNSEHRLSALLQLHLHPQLNTWLQWIG